MNKKFMFVVVVIILVAVVLVSLLYFLQSPVSQLLPKGEEYLNFTSNYQGGAETKVYLVNSTLNYGVYGESLARALKNS